MAFDFGWEVGSSARVDWRIGTGKATSSGTWIWHPPQLVSELIDHTSATWDVAKLQEFFTNANREAIMTIPLCNRRQPDFWAWHHDRTGS